MKPKAGLILAGGMGLGAYQMGAVTTLVEGIDIGAVAGTSIGAINGAIIAGNAPDDRALKLRAFWETFSASLVPGPWEAPPGPWRHAQSWASAAGARLGGVPGLFAPRLAFLSAPHETPSLYDSTPLAHTLPRFVDFDRLNGAEVRFCMTTVDVEQGEVVTLNTHAGDRIGVEHLLAAGGLLPDFPTVRIDGRLLGDGGLAVNAPLEPFLSSARTGDVPPLLILLDLFAPDGPAPQSLEAASERANDLKFAMQTGVRLDGLVRERALEASLAPEVAGTDLLHLSYRSGPDEAGPEKPFDFSRAAVARRAATGAADASAALAHIASISPTGAGLRIHNIREPAAYAEVAASQVS